jgi:hypothetical protein
LVSQQEAVTVAHFVPKYERRSDCRKSSFGVVYYLRVTVTSFGAGVSPGCANWLVIAV